MSMDYVPSIVPEEYSAAMLEEELRRIQEVLTLMQTIFVEHVPQTAAPAHPQEGWVVNADGDNWNPGFGAGMYTYLEGRWEPMSGKDFLIEVNKGLVPGHSMVHRFGSNDNVGTTTEDIWEYGGLLTFLTAAETMDVVSTDVNDTAAGTGARSVKLTGVDDSFTVISETIALNGTTLVTTTATFRRVDLLEVTEVGALGATNRGASNVGVITATATTAATVQNSISVGASRSDSSHYTVPTGFSAFLTRISISMDTGKAVDVTLKFREAADDITVPVSPAEQERHWKGLDVPISETLTKMHKFPEKTDVWFEGVVSSGTAAIDTEYDLLLIDDTYLV